MEILLAADHRGFELKERLKEILGARGFLLRDAGAAVYDPADDYVDFALSAATEIAKEPTNRRGIFICGSGVGMDVVANKFKGLRAVLAHDRRTAIQSREHGDANILVLAADGLALSRAEEIAVAWLETPFSGEERHARRLEKIREIEEQNFK